jgi:hypothetical protein
MGGRPTGRDPKFRQSFRIVAYAVAFLIVCVGIRIVMESFTGSGTCVGIEGPAGSGGISYSSGSACQISEPHKAIVGQKR